MMMRRALLSAAAVAFVAGGVHAQNVLQTEPPNNGSGGVWMELTDLTQSGEFIRIDQIDIGGFTGTVGTDVGVEVWTRPGTYVGFDTDPAGWTLTQTITVTRQGTTETVEMRLDEEIEVEDGETLAVYLQATESQGIRYTGTNANPPQTTFEDANLRLFSDLATTSGEAFTGSRFTPRTFSGALHYEVIDNGEPPCIADWNGDGEVDINDFFAYLSDFEAGDPRADLNNDGEIDINDFFIFLTEFEAGC